jgi:hypothetical protein
MIFLEIFAGNAPVMHCLEEGTHQLTGLFTIPSFHHSIPE